MSTFLDRISHIYTFMHLERKDKYYCTNLKKLKC